MRKWCLPFDQHLLFVLRSNNTQLKDLFEARAVTYTSQGKHIPNVNVTLAVRASHGGFNNKALRKANGVFDLCSLYVGY
jgi:hypothetical protein